MNLIRRESPSCASYDLKPHILEKPDVAIVFGRARSRCLLLSEMRHRSLDSIQDLVEVFAEVGGEEAEDEVAVFLEECVFAAIAAVGRWVVEVLVAVEF
ncbi:MAG: hypothetical protein ACJAVK_003143 [Akkermansiaceae bacterium]|jgi:hypothetical protein